MLASGRDNACTLTRARILLKSDSSEGGAKWTYDCWRVRASAVNGNSSLIDLVGYERAREIVDFCFIANPYYPTQAMVDELTRRLPELIRSYPSSNPLVGARHLAGRDWAAESAWAA